MNIYHLFPNILDWTQVSAYRACPVKWFYKHCLHLRQEKSVHLHFGGAYADGLEIARRRFYVENHSQLEAVALGKEAIQEFWGDPDLFADERKNLDTCLQLLDLNFMEYPLGTDEYQPVIITSESGTKDAAIEFSFMEEIDVPAPDGTQMYYTGRADMLTESVLHPGAVLVFDDKTTGGYITDNLRNSWQMRGQFSGYVWGLQRAGYPASGAVIAIASIPKRGNITFDRQLAARNKQQVANWERGMLQTARDMVSFYQDMIKYHAQQPDKSVPDLAPTSNMSESCTAFFRPCYYTRTCTGQVQDDIVATQQAIWLPHEQRNAELSEFLDMIGADLDEHLWATYEPTVIEWGF